MKTLTDFFNIQKAPKSKIDTLDWDNIPFGRMFSDHMLLARYSEGAWQQPEIVPYGPLEFHPALLALNYSQSIFEGLKAYRSVDERPSFFRLDANYERMNTSAHRMCMPDIPEEIFMGGIKKLVELDKHWVPSMEKGSLYVRPLYFGTDQYIGVHPSETYLFTVFTCPVGMYYARPVNLLVTRDYVRAAAGGTGAAKTAGNYAASLYPDKVARAAGYDNMLWLDAKELKYVEECGTMNVFFVIDGKVVTPELSGTILPGITRDSVLQLLRANGYEVEERKVAIDEIYDAYKAGNLTEAFGAGTAATIAHIAKIGYEGEDMILPSTDQRPVGNWLGKKLSDIKLGIAKDDFGWMSYI